MTIKQHADFSVTCNMAAYIQKICSKHGVTKSQATPSTLSLFNEMADTDKIINDEHTVRKYKSELMELSYLTKARPDIVKEINYLATLTPILSANHFDRIHRIREYLYGTMDTQLLFNSEIVQLEIHADAAYAIHDKVKSHSGYFLRLKDSAPILVKSTIQKLVSTSSTEAEVISAVDAVKKSIQIAKMLTEFKLLKNIPILYQDNKSALTILADGEGFTKKSKHFRIRFQFLSEMFKYEEIKLRYLPTELMIPDFLTKPMVGDKFHKFVEAIMNGKMLK
jgi:hypothetical protein